jgi:phenylacetate-coenzyme A ligase PaaK-like adenylate-forming protein
MRDMLRNAVKASPYYRDTIGHLVAREAPLKDFPVLTKKDLVANFDRIVTDRRLRQTDIEQHLAGERAGDLMFGQYRACATGGTSGVRAVIVYDQTAWANAAANAVRSLRTAGVTAEARLIGIGAPTPQHFSCRIYEEMRFGRSAVPRLYVTTPLPEIVAALNEFQPDAIATYPSFIRRLAEEQMEGRLKISVKRFCSSAEALMPDVRDLALQVWGATISNRFAATEMGMAGSECEHFSGMHLPEDLVAFEAVDENYRKVPSGVPGSRLLITTLTNSVLPLIRYELSDGVTVTDAPCPCGRPHARITSIEGRREHVLKFPKRGGGHVDIHAFRLSSHLIGMPGVSQYQLVPGPDDLCVRLSLRRGVPEAETRAAVERKIHSVLNELGAETPVTVEIVKEIERTGTGAKANLVARREAATGPAHLPAMDGALHW